ncbi:hypothetical protein [Mycobacterium sp. E740]|uniref:hypothetical protein n=1 Tax=Mycobacterium sp. E740 TaxID=1834149 RepID=UPI000ABEB715|nr:hypothetical protein [Mycobacterium sp. E740]
MNDAFMLSAFVGLGAAISARWMPLATGRVVFWIGTACACVSVFLMTYPPEWQSGLLMSLFVGCATVVTAYINTEFISIGGKTYTLFADSHRIDDYGGGLTAKKAWWLATLGVAMIILIAIVYYVAGAGAWVPTAGCVVIIGAALSFGYRDAATAQRLASGQQVQFGLLSVMTVGIFSVAYLGSYHGCKRWLVKRQAYGRHQRRHLE